MQNETQSAAVVAAPYHGARFIIAYKGASLDGMSYPTAEAAQAELDAIRAAVAPSPPAGEGEPVAWRARVEAVRYAWEVMQGQCSDGDGFTERAAHDLDNAINALSDPLPPPSPDAAQQRIAALEEALTRISKGARMQARAMRDPQRTGGWSGAEKVADALDDIADRAVEALK
jgi:hypothetical protein